MLEWSVKNPPGSLSTAQEVGELLARTRSDSPLELWACVKDCAAVTRGMAVYVTTRVSESVPAAFVAEMEMFQVVLLVPVGVPEITPVLVLTDNPDGRLVAL
jgi:hypothetical protein